MLVEFEKIARDLSQRNLDFGGRGVEVLSPQIDSVNSLVSESAVQLGLDAYCVIGEEQRMDVEAEWN